MSVGFGTDTYAFDTLLTGRLATGAELVAQALFRRLITSRGTLQDGPDGEVYGLDLQDFIGSVGPRNAIDALPDVVRAEMVKDDRVESAEAAVDAVYATDGTVTLTISISVTLADEGGDFVLTVAASEVSTAFLGVSL